MHPVFKKVAAPIPVDVPVPVIPMGAVYFYFEIDEFSGWGGFQVHS